MKKKIKNILDNSLVEFIKKGICFDLQFRRDIRYKRRNHPTYYRWKAQFIVVSNKNNKESIKKIKNVLNCGKVYFGKNQIRYAIQRIDDLHNIIIPFLKNKKLPKRKEKKLSLWIKAVRIIYRHKRKKLATWKEKDFQSLLEIYNLMQEKKKKVFRKGKWTSMAKLIAKTLKLSPAKN